MVSISNIQPTSGLGPRLRRSQPMNLPVARRTSERRSGWGAEALGPRYVGDSGGLAASRSPAEMAVGADGGPPRSRIAHSPPATTQLPAATPPPPPCSLLPQPARRRRPPPYLPHPARCFPYRKPPPLFRLSSFCLISIAS